MDSSGSPSPLDEAPDAAQASGAGESLASTAYSPEQQRQMQIWLSVVAVLGLCGWLGVFGFARLVNDLPLLLIVLSPVNRHLIPVSAVVPPLTFVAVALPRLLLSCFIAFQLGRSVGPAGLEWLDGNSPSTGRFVRWIERLFTRSAVGAMLIWPGFPVSMLAGVSGLSLRRTLLWSALGLLVRLLLIVELGQALQEPIQWVLGVIDTYWREFTLLTLLIWAGYQALRRLTRKPAPTAERLPDSSAP